MIPNIVPGPWVYLFHRYAVWCEKEDEVLLKRIGNEVSNVVSPFGPLMHAHDAIREIATLEAAIGQPPSAIVCIEKGVDGTIQTLRTYAEMNKIPFHFFDQTERRRMMREAHGPLDQCRGQMSRLVVQETVEV